MWGLEPSQQWKNFFGIIVLQFVSMPLGWYGILYYHDYAPPAVSLWLLLCSWTWHISFSLEFQPPPVDGYSVTVCEFGALARGDEPYMSFYDAILNQ